MTWHIGLRDNAGDERSRLSVHAEFDGRVKYLGDSTASSDVVVAEKLREDAIRATGGAVRRFVYDDLRDEEAAFGHLCSAFPRSFIARLKPRWALMPPLEGRGRL
ncbi:hypothetical protein [Georgenia sp. AZ-5]|uniref:hypothetical protein n=1 Tax=Georgenia sp. AZ-5 TaxID=3367526 RepID=UPI0037544020